VIGEEYSNLNSDVMHAIVIKYLKVKFYRCHIQ